MILDTQISIPPEQSENNAYILQLAAIHSGIDQSRITNVEIRKRSIDARAKVVKFQLAVRLWVDEVYMPETLSEPHFNNVINQEEINIIGAGPAGLFAAIRLIELGKKPVIIERGKDVQARRRDLVEITRNHLVNTESNYCFGEGGAGTYSDGKLYTRSDKRGDIRKTLDWFIFFGASPEIKINARPHIGTNKLPGIITQMREYILSAGGEIHFNTRLDNLEVRQGNLKSITLNNKSQKAIQKLILSTGHSSRMIFEMLHQNKISIEAKPFALGVRIEHPQSLIDKIQYHCNTRPDYLPPAYYSLVEQIEGRGVYSFCMCPGGIIAPCATSPGEIVTNGWSPSKRNNPFANSGMVVELKLEDIYQYTKCYDALAAMKFQQQIEQLACKLGGGTQTAPAQRMVDFCEGKLSIDLPECSYTPGITSVDLKEVLPELISKRLKKGMQQFGKKMKGYYTNEATLVAVESRTSSPVKIPRDVKTLMHPEVYGLFPCGEGAGYAGGIISAAIDGMRCAEKAAEN